MKYVWCPLLLVGALGSVAQAQAPIGRVTATQRIVERASGNSTFRAVKSGTSLLVGDSVRTGRRSKADLNFSDGSLLRLGQLATVQMQGTKTVTLSSGRVLFSMLRPGRVLAGTAAAEIKGSVGIITIMDNGDTEFSLYSGRMDVVTAKETVPVPPGSYVTIFGDGTRSPVRTAPPLRFASNQKEMSLLQAPLDVPFVGSQDDEQSRQTPERLLLSDTYYLARQRTALPFPPALAVRANENRGSGTDALLALALAVGTGALAQPEKAESADAAHLNEANPALGRKFNTDTTLAVLGAKSDSNSGNSVLLAGRVRAFYSQGPVFAQVALTPRAYRRNRENDSYLDIVSDASVTLHTNRGDFEVGRQRLLGGPSRATVIGAIARQGGRQVVDALTFRPNLGRGQSAQVSYLVEAYPLHQPYDVAGAQRGFYGRAALHRRYGNFGVSVLRYANLPVRTATGITLDFALPVVRNKLELYGEAGRDPYRRQLRSVGLAFPGLYESSGVEAYLEYARLSRRTDAIQPPNELTLQLYKRLDTKWSLSASLSHLSNSSNLATIGLTTSTHKYLSDGD